MISLITRVQSPTLYDRMTKSANDTAFGEFEAYSEQDKVHLPKCAETYNRLASQCTGDILCFVEDDIEFLSNDWDRIAEDLFTEYDCDILGVVGSTEYHGGLCFEAGREYSFGQVACNKSKTEEETWVRILSERFRYKKVKVIDGSLMFVKKDFFLKERFDEKTFDELYFYDFDLCLRSEKVAITSDILVKHSKPPEMHGVYPKHMKTIDQYEPTLLERYGITKRPSRNQTCCFVSMDTLKRDGQTECFKQFERKYQCALV